MDQDLADHIQRIMQVPSRIHRAKSMNHPSTDMETLSLLVEELAQQPMKQGQAGALRRLLQATKPTVYLTELEDSVLVSAYSVNHENEQEAENYTVDIIALRGAGTQDSARNSITILRNILERAGVSVIIE